MPEPQAGGDFTWPQQWGFNCLSSNPSTQLWSTGSACRLICYCCSGLVIVLTTGRGASRAGLGLIHAAANCHQHPLHLGWKHLGRSPSDPINNLHTQLLNSQHLARVRLKDGCTKWLLNFNSVPECYLYQRQTCLYISILQNALNEWFKSDILKRNPTSNYKKNWQKNVWIFTLCSFLTAKLW